MNKKPATGAIIKTVILCAIIALAVIAACTNLLPEPLHRAAESALNQFSSSGNFAITLPRVLAAVVAVSICMLVVQVTSLILSHLATRNRRMLTVSSLLKSLISWVAVIIAVIWCLSIFGIDVTAALASVGIVALVLSFGAQSLVEDVVTGIFIIVEGSFNVGDIVVLDDFRGTVRSISIRTTSIEDTGGNIKIVNNSDIRNIQNRSCNISVAVSDVSIAYDASIPEAEAVLARCLDELWEKHQDILVEKPTYAGVQALADSAVVLRLLAKTKEENIFTVQRLLNRAAKLALDEAGIEIPFPQVVVHQGK